MLKYTVLLLLIAQTSIYAAEQNQKEVLYKVLVLENISHNPPVDREVERLMVGVKSEEIALEDIEKSLEECFPDKKVAIKFIYYGPGMLSRAVWDAKEKLSFYNHNISYQPGQGPILHAYLSDAISISRPTEYNKRQIIPVANDQ